MPVTESPEMVLEVPKQLHLTADGALVSQSRNTGSSLLCRRVDRAPLSSSNQEQPEAPPHSSGLYTQHLCPSTFQS